MTYCRNMKYEMGGVAQEVEDTEVRNKQTDSPKCHKFDIKDCVISEFLKLM